jgi:type I restriction enzyme R subunit
MLQQSGWIVQDRSQINLAAGTGVAVREAVLKAGEADYLLFAAGKAIATVEAKPDGYMLTGFATSANRSLRGQHPSPPRRDTRAKRTVGIEN